MLLQHGNKAGLSHIYKHSILQQRNAQSVIQHSNASREQPRHWCAAVGPITNAAASPCMDTERNTQPFVQPSRSLVFSSVRETFSNQHATLSLWRPRKATDASLSHFFSPALRQPKTPNHILKRPILGVTYWARFQRQALSRPLPHSAPSAFSH
jgi:hypothetical protein